MRSLLLLASMLCAQSLIAQARSCVPDATTLCFHRIFAITAVATHEGSVQHAHVGARFPASGTFWITNPDAQDILVRLADNCVTNHVFTLGLASIRAVRVTVVDLRVQHEQEYALDTNATFTTIPCGGRR